MKNLLEGLSEIHAKNIIHRDLKPENLILRDKKVLSSLKVSDFGLSAKLKTSKLFLRCGTPGFVAPEILNDEGYDSKADIFSAGVILYMMLTGKSVFPANTGKEVIKKNTEC